MPTRSQEILKPSVTRMMKHWRVLCSDIGIRLAGTENEQRAADYISVQFEKSGLKRVHQESFACRSFAHGSAQVAVKDGGRWRTVAARPLVGAPGTPGAKSVEGEIVWLAMPEGGHRLKKDSLKGRVVAVFGELPTSSLSHRRLVEANPLAVIAVDDRLPFEWPKNDGIIPLWADRHGMPPTVTVAYREAWEWRKRRSVRVRVKVRVNYVDALSQNVVGDVPGTHPGAGMIILGAHHDTQCENPGADDNASGVVMLLELAKMFGRKPRRRTIRLISFGTEEQLSVGALAYVKAHRQTMEQVAMMVNFDSIASPLGHVLMMRLGPPGLERFAVKAMHDRDVDVVPCAEVTPFSDHFCFGAVGIPTLWFYRSNCAGNGRWQHHSEFDNLENISPEVLAELATAAGGMIQDAAQRRRMPFARGFDPLQEKRIRELAKELYGLKGGENF